MQAFIILAIIVIVCLLIHKWIKLKDNKSFIEHDIHEDYPIKRIKQSKLQKRIEDMSITYKKERH